MLTSELIQQVKNDTISGGAGSTNNTQILFWLNAGLRALHMERRWKSLKRKFEFVTTGDYSTGTVSVTNGSATITGGTAFLTNVKVGQRIKANDDTISRVILSVDSDSQLTLVAGDEYGGTTKTGASFTVLGIEEYRLPLQWSEAGFLWHQDFGYPYKLIKIDDQDFYGGGFDLNFSDTPEMYRLWGESGVEIQPLAAGAIAIKSSSSSDTTQTVRVAGLVSGVPDFEDVLLTGTTAANTSKSFSRIDRVSISGSTVGRITLTSDSANVTNLTIPSGKIYDNMTFLLTQFWPIPSDAITIFGQTWLRHFDLVDDNDVHPFGSEFDQALVLYADHKASLQLAQGNAAQFQPSQLKTAYNDEVKRLKRWEGRDSDVVFRMRERGEHSGRRSRDRQFINFGAQFGRVPK